MTNRSQDNELRSVIFHWSLVICHWSFVICQISRDAVRSKHRGPGSLVRAEAAQESIQPALDPEGDATGEGRFSVSPHVEGLAKKISMEIDRPDCKRPAEDHLRFHRLELLRQEFWVARRIEKRIGRVLPCHRQTDVRKEALDPRPVIREEILHLFRGSDANDL